MRFPSFIIFATASYVQIRARNFSYIDSKPQKPETQKAAPFYSPMHRTQEVAHNVHRTMCRNALPRCDEKHLARIPCCSYPKDPIRTQATRSVPKLRVTRNPYPRTHRILTLKSRNPHPSEKSACPAQLSTWNVSACPS